jgi:hypothetical protein
VIGMAGSWLKIPMSAFGVAFIGNMAALTMFGVGLLIRGYTMPLTGIDITQYYVPHGFMVGAGIVALVQVIITISERAPVVGVAISAETVVPGSATGASHEIDIAAVVKFAVEVAKEFGRATAEFYDSNEFVRLNELYGSMHHLRRRAPRAPE